MESRGFGKNSGPNSHPLQKPFGNFPNVGFPSPPRPITTSNEPPLIWGAKESFKEHGAQTYQRHLSSNSQKDIPAKASELQNRRTSSPYFGSPDKISNNSSGLIQRPQPPSQVYQNSQYVGSHHPPTEEVQRSPFSPTAWGSQLKPSSYTPPRPPPQDGTSSILITKGSYKSGPAFHAKHADVSLPKRTRSPTKFSGNGGSPESTVFHPPGQKRSLIDYADLDAPEAMTEPSLAFASSFSSRGASRTFVGSERPFTPPTVANQSRSWSNNATPPVQENTPSVLIASDNNQSGRTLQDINTDIPFPKRTRSPTLPFTGGGFPHNPAVALDGHRRASDFESQNQSSASGQTNRTDVALDNPMEFSAVKRTKIPILSPSNQDFQENLDSAEESDRELRAKAKRLARFKDELSEPMQSNSSIGSQNIPTKRQHRSMPEKQMMSEEPTVDAVGSSGGNAFSELEGVASSSIIVGLCPDMCPESERAERERKGDLDQYERVDGDRNMTSEFLAVKKYTRTAEREARLIRPMPILQKTMDYLLNLLDGPYDDQFLGLYNFLWDRMRAIRMDLRMQHIFNLDATRMLEQMIRLHIIAMHELCEYTKGEGFSEGFDAHLNIEQMNKTSVELFQLYDDHRKKGIHVPSEQEFRGYYALLKLDKHPGYKVEPAELSLDLAKMTQEMRRTPEVLFARDVARACRTGNFISFFRLAGKASYLQACLMHAHFSKLRTQALASLNSGLQINQGIPVAHVAKWLGLEGEDIWGLLEYYGLSVKDFEEPYMVKEAAFINTENDFPVKRSKLVERKRSGAIANDISFPSLAELFTDDEVKFQSTKDPKPVISTTLSSFVPVCSVQLHDEEIHDDLGTISSPKDSVYKAPIDLVTSNEEEMAGHETPPASPVVSNFSKASPEILQRVDSAPNTKLGSWVDAAQSISRSSFGKSMNHDLVETPLPITLDAAEEIRYHVQPLDSVHTPTPQPTFNNKMRDEETGIMEEDRFDEETTSHCDKEVAEAKLKLIFRTWKRHTLKKKELRERKQLAANAAMNLLSVGPPIWQLKDQSGDYGIFNIDHVMSERDEIIERSWSVLNPSSVVAAKLVEKNPDARVLCWKMIICTQELSTNGDNIGRQNEASLSDAGLWFHSKLMPTNTDADDLLISSPGLALWRNWLPGLSGPDWTCCLSVIKSTTFGDVNETGVSAVLFLLSENIPAEIQKKRLHDLVISFPSGSRLPLLIFASSGSGREPSDASSIAKELGVDEFDNSVIATYNIAFLKDQNERNLDAFFSDRNLREGLEWLASKSPPQIMVNKIKTRELVISHLNSILEVLDETIQDIGPNNCISAFNEALDRSTKEVIAAAEANPTGWPCPEINMLEPSSYEHRAAVCYFPSFGWSSALKTQAVTCRLKDTMLPALENDLPWLSGGLTTNDDIYNQKALLENCLVNYLTVTSQMMETALAQKEANTVVQKCTLLQLHNNTYYIIPNWVSIFRRVFSWRLMNLTNGEISSTYVLEQHYSSAPSSKAEDGLYSKSVTFVPFFIDCPSLDELVEVGLHSLESGMNQLEEYDEAYLALSPVGSGPVDLLTSKGDVSLMEREEKSAKDGALTSYHHSTREDNRGELMVRQATKATTKEANKLTALLEKCNIMQNLIDEKLAVYF